MIEPQAVWFDLRMIAFSWPLWRAASLTSLVSEQQERARAGPAARRSEPAARMGLVMTRTLLAAALGAALFMPVGAGAQSGDMSCADYLAADAQMAASMSAADRAAMQADPQAAAIDGKMRAYCKLHPTASSSEAAMAATK